jgi:hypothetical protein
MTKTMKSAKKEKNILHNDDHRHYGRDYHYHNYCCHDYIAMIVTTTQTLPKKSG